jgi:hypothetical protein
MAPGVYKPRSSHPPAPELSRAAAGQAYGTPGAVPSIADVDGGHVVSMYLAVLPPTSTPHPALDHTTASTCTTARNPSVRDCY